MLRRGEFWLCSYSSPFGRVGRPDGPGPGPREVVIDPPCRAGEVPGPTPDPPFQSPGLDLCRLVHDPRRIADRDPSLLHRQPARRNGGTVFRQHPGGVNHCSPAHPQQRGRFPLSERTVQICTILLSRPSGGRRRRGLVGFGSMTALFQFPARGNGSGQARLQEPLYESFLWVAGRRAARRPSGRRPSRFPAPAFHGRSTH